MKYVDEFRDRSLGSALERAIREAARRKSHFTIMEVCGTHTMSIFRFGIQEMLPGNIRLVSGPGCPVCVTPTRVIDTAIALSAREDVIIATFGDMIKVPGSDSSLERERARGRAVKVVYSPLDALEIAGQHPADEVVFLGVGFETTVPTVAETIREAAKRRLRNFSVLCAHKTMPAALAALVRDTSMRIDGFLLPAHVSAVIGTGPYEFLALRYRKHCAIAGFEPLDILQGIAMILSQTKPAIDNQYARVVRKSGNRRAQRIIDEVFEETVSEWRGIGAIRKSGLRIKKRFGRFDAQKKFSVDIEESREPAGCVCGEVIKGKKTPTECPLFRRACTPEHPVGPCMVSSEGTCSAYYKYNSNQ